MPHRRTLSHLDSEPFKLPYFEPTHIPVFPGTSRTLGIGVPGLWLVCLFGSSWLSCGEGPDCRPQTESRCQDSNTYWLDSCGNRGDIRENCLCGCLADRTACAPCNCSCTQAGACCDGCHPRFEGGRCDDGNPETVNDACREGTCSAWPPADIPLPQPPQEPAPVAQPEPPRLQSWACPPGWSPVVHELLLDENGDPFSWCQPPAPPRLKLGAWVTPLKEGEDEAQRPICEPQLDNTFPLLGHADCQPLGDPCPDAGDWPRIPEGIPGGRIYVRAGFVGGDGATEDTPLGTLAAAVTAASDGDVVVLAAGTFQETVIISGNLTLWGACASRTVIDAPGPHAGPQTGALVVEEDARLDLRSLRISGEQIGLYLNSAQAQVDLQGIWIHEATRHGMLIKAGRALLTNVLVDSTRPAEGQLGRGLSGSAGAQVVMQGITLEINHDMGIYAGDDDTRLALQDVLVRHTRSLQTELIQGLGLVAMQGAELTCQRALLDANREAAAAMIGSDVVAALEDVVFTDTLSSEAGKEYGLGLVASDNARVTLSRGLVERNRTWGVFVLDGAEVELENMVIRDTRSEEYELLFGRGLEVSSTGRALVRRALLEGNREFGAGALGSSASLELHDVVIRNTLPLEATDVVGRGLSAGQGGSVSCTRGWLDANHGGGVVAAGQGTLVELDDIRISGTRGTESGNPESFGLLASEGAHLTLLRGVLEENQRIGIYLGGADTRVQLADLTVRDTLSTDTSPPRWGIGMTVTDGAQLVLTRGEFDHNRMVGIQVYEAGTRVTLEDIAVLDTASQDETLDFGRGLEVAQGASLTMARARFEGNRESGIAVGMVTTTADMTDVTIRGTLAQESDGTKGMGLVVDQGAQANLLRVLIEDNRSTGLTATSEATLVTLQDVAVRNTRSQLRNQSLGMGLQVSDGAEVDCKRSLFEENRTHGIVIVHPGTLARLEDTTVRGTQGQQSDGLMGSGLAVGLGARAEIVRGLFALNHELGVMASDAGTTLALEKVVIRETLPRACSQGQNPTCGDFGGGMGLGVYREGAITFGQVHVSDSHLAGLQIAKQGTISGDILDIVRSVIGVNIQEVPEDYDFFEAVGGLMMKDNDISFDSSALPLPAPLGWIE